jgi:hypothetical protein
MQYIVMEHQSWSLKRRYTDWTYVKTHFQSGLRIITMSSTSSRGAIPAFSLKRHGEAYHCPDSCQYKLLKLHPIKICTYYGITLYSVSTVIHKYCVKLCLIFHYGTMHHFSSLFTSVAYRISSTWRQDNGN